MGEIISEKILIFTIRLSTLNVLSVSKVTCSKFVSDISCACMVKWL